MVEADVAELQVTQDQLLDRLIGGDNPGVMTRWADGLVGLVGSTARTSVVTPKKRGSLPVRVVIAEDEAIVRLDLKEIMEEEGYEVVGETGRGDEAVELVRTHRPDLAILDIKMPGSDGLSAAREISAERLSAVLILTAFSQRDLIEQARTPAPWLTW